jgi:hypothetical protein
MNDHSDHSGLSEMQQISTPSKVATLSFKLMAILDLSTSVAQMSICIIVER